MTYQRMNNWATYFVFQEKLSDTFRQASAKIGATIGLRLAEQEENAAAAEAEKANIAGEAQDPSNTEEGNDPSVRVCLAFTTHYSYVAALR